MWNKLMKIKNILEQNGLPYSKNGKGEHCHFGPIDCFLLKQSGEFLIGDSKTYCHVDEYTKTAKQIFGFTFVNAPFCSKRSLSHRYGKTYFREGDVNDNFHYKNKKIQRFQLHPADYSYQLM